MPTKLPSNTYGTVKVPGIKSLCYKFPMHKPVPSGFRCVGNGNSYQYITNDTVNPAVDLVVRISAKGPGQSEFSPESWGIGMNRRKIIATLKARAASFNTPTDAPIVEVTTATGFELRIEF